MNNNIIENTFNFIKLREWFVNKLSKHLNKELFIVDYDMNTYALISKQILKVEVENNTLITTHNIICYIETYNNKLIISCDINTWKDIKQNINFNELPNNIKIVYSYISSKNSIHMEFKKLKINKFNKLNIIIGIIYIISLIIWVLLIK